MANDVRAMRDAIWRITGSTEKRLPESVIIQAINDVCNDISSRGMISYDERKSTLTFLDGAYEVDLPSNVRLIYALIYDGSPVEFMQLREFTETYTSPADSTALCNYTTFAEKLLVTGVPDDDSFSVDIWYYQRPTDLSEPDGTNGYLTNSWELVKYGVLASVVIDLIEDNRHPLFLSRYETLLRRFLIEQAHRHHFAGFIENTIPGE